MSLHHQGRHWHHSLDCPRQKAGQCSRLSGGMCQRVEVGMQAVDSAVRGLLGCPVGEE